MQNSKRLMLVALVLTLAACSNASGPASGSSVSLSFATLRASPAAATDRDPSSGAAAHTIVVTSAQIVLDRIELAPANATCQDENGDAGQQPDGDRAHVVAADDGRDGNDSECEDLATGPVLVDLPVGQSVVTMFDVPVAAGTYTSLEARLEPANANTAAGSAFLAAHADLAGASVRVTGTFDGTPFTYTGAPQSHLESSFDPPVVAGASGVNVTVHVSLDRWFQGPDGALVDPATANAGGPNADLVAQNIGRSFHAFRDDERRGDDGLGDD